MSNIKEFLKGTTNGLNKKINQPSLVKLMGKQGWNNGRPSTKNKK
tara:strand:+ start:3429 stop:3563 length:135 start_codon:yes stop_codon:yes gene_type:complete